MQHGGYLNKRNKTIFFLVICSGALQTFSQIYFCVVAGLTLNPSWSHSLAPDVWSYIVAWRRVVAIVTS